MTLKDGELLESCQSDRQQSRLVSDYNPAMIRLLPMSFGKSDTPLAPGGTGQRAAAA